ncbi:hypothetical protein CLU85_2335 [Acidovorax sp. 69]|uniref:hypothetical protein n=1 Tax=Acidovorax sp. 69 TaxID=2035202 RepID=UPI000C23DCFC|nr:hypothetical protein [Acidovorax sp. 69]PJI97543.1 hypothetical protein CLU85_2335 [Acidovorax sp. 69]
MQAPIQRLFCGLVIAALGCAGAIAPRGAQAGGGTGSYPLGWSRPGEVLEYRSCGCADACWVAQVKNRQTRQTLAALRCDCAKAYATVGARGRERVYAETCAAFEAGDKSTAIQQSLEALLDR